MADALRTCNDLETEREAMRARLAAQGDDEEEPPSSPAAPPPCSQSVGEMCLKGMNLKVVHGIKLPPEPPPAPPMKPGNVIGVGRLLNRANPQASPTPSGRGDQAVMEHSDACKEMNPVQTAAHLAKALHDPAPLFAVVVLECGSTEVYKASDLGNGHITKVSPIEMMEAFANRDGPSPILIKYDVEQKKLNALVPK
jgi:hypothetical protein